MQICSVYSVFTAEIFDRLKRARFETTALKYEYFATRFTAKYIFDVNVINVIFFFILTSLTASHVVLKFSFSTVGFFTPMFTGVREFITFFFLALQTI